MEDIRLPIIIDSHREASRPQFSQLAEDTTHKDLPLWLYDSRPPDDELLYRMLAKRYFSGLFHRCTIALLGGVQILHG